MKITGFYRRSQDFMGDHGISQEIKIIYQGEHRILREVTGFYRISQESVGDHGIFQEIMESRNPGVKVC